MGGLRQQDVFWRLHLVLKEPVDHDHVHPRHLVEAGDPRPHGDAVVGDYLEPEFHRLLAGDAGADV